jgi:large repetitive protein
MTGTDAANTPVDVTVTSETDGTYSFPEVVAGTYTLIETQPAAYSDGAETIGTAGGTLAPPDTVSGLAVGVATDYTKHNFGELGATISGSVWYDVNRDGVIDPTETTGLATTVTLYAADGTTLIATTTTDPATGAYSFPDLPVGDYVVVETQPTGYASSFTTPNIHPVSLPLAGVTGVNFGDTLGTLAGTVYNDLDGDGTQDSGEPGIAGVTITLTRVGSATPTTAITAADGTYVFNDLLADSYTITETQPVTYNDGQELVGTLAGSAAADAFSAVVLPAGTDGSGYLFGELGATISGTVWYDADRDGAIDTGETRKLATTVTLFAADGTTLIATTTSDPSTGGYRFEDLPAGSYVVVETQPAGFGSSPSTPNTHPVTLPLAGLTDVNFGDTLATVNGVVFHDIDRDGVQDPDETGIADVVVKLLDADGEPTAFTAITDSSGHYLIVDVPAGSYTVSEAQPVGYGSSTPDTVAITVPAGGDVTTPFGETTSSLSGVVYIDTDRDGAKDSVENGMPGVTVALTGEDEVGDPVSVTVTTGPDGTWIFDDLLGGDYRLTESQPPLFADGEDTVGTAGGSVCGTTTLTVAACVSVIDAINLDRGEVATGYAFGENGSSIGNRVWKDDNDNGVQDSGEPGLGGMTVRLLDSSGDLVASTVTRSGTALSANPLAEDGPGFYLFTDLPAGSYIIEIRTSDGFVPSSAHAGGNDDDSDVDRVTGRTSVIVVGLNEHRLDIDAGVVPPGAITGQVFVDTNRNGVRDGAEEPIADIVLHLVDASGKVVATTTTDANGNFRFDDVPIGQYTITEEQPLRYRSTTPDALTVTVKVGEVNSASVFGEVPTRLPTTGGSIFMILAMGLGATLIGAALVLVRRRRLA